MVLGHDRGFAVEGRSGGRFGVDRVGLAPLAAHLTVGAIDLDDLDAVVLEVASEADAVGTSALDTDPFERAETLRPAPQSRVAPRVGVKDRRVEDLASLIDDGCHVEVLVGVNPAEHAEWFFCHDGSAFLIDGMAPPAGLRTGHTRRLSKRLSSQVRPASWCIPGKELGRQITHPGAKPVTDIESGPTPCRGPNQYVCHRGRPTSMKRNPRQSTITLQLGRHRRVARLNILDVNSVE